MRGYAGCLGWILVQFSQVYTAAQADEAEIICGTIAFADAIEPDSSSIFSNVALYSSLGACAEAEGAA